ncbi:hypothetical protein CIG75_08990 [Tumebacillus algifaecis]|uniref:DUF4034 domain-containing protein n=1 Tax=Tumebacillus algifaecis TaxID=1214604 RepID=A0A223D015_9BACL|nr:hypothetical protein [Tumebacillus algifaecis]ASS75099.1 hypothetical protein CIG75_08990 [Tumebacillus algifaecis]
MNYQAQLSQLESQADMLPDGDAKVALLQQAIQLADAHNELIDSFELREKLIDASVGAGDPMRMLVAFSWCLTQMDKHPYQFEPTRMLWQYKWVVGHIDALPQITRTQVDALMEDMKTRYEAQGLSLRPYYRQQHAQAMYAGDRARADTAYRLWLAAAIDDFCDCNACERAHQVEYMVWLGEDEKALALAETILNGQLACSTVPHNTLHDLLEALVRLDRLEDAQELQKRGYAKIENEPSFMHGFANHIRFLALTDPEQAITLFHKHLRQAQDTSHLRNKFRYFLAGWLLYERLHREGQQNDLLPWLITETRALADAFDQRNGNTYHATLIDKTLALLY